MVKRTLQGFLRFFYVRNLCYFHKKCTFCGTYTNSLRILLPNVGDVGDFELPGNVGNVGDFELSGNVGNVEGIRAPDPNV